MVMCGVDNMNVQEKEKIDPNTMLGKFCSINPNICMYANGMMTKYEEPAFTGVDFPFILQEWSNTPTCQTLCDFSDAYWIAKCWMRFWREYDAKIVEFMNNQMVMATPKSIIYLRCFQLSKDIPNVEVRGVPGCLLWSEIETAIETVKRQMRIIYPITPKYNFIVNPKGMTGAVFDTKPDLLKLAKGDIDYAEETKKYNELCDELMEVVEMWVVMIDPKEKIETRLLDFHEQVRENESNASLVKTTAQLASDLCDVYWMFKGWYQAVNYMIETDKDDLPDDDVITIMNEGKMICLMIDGLNLHDTEKVFALSEKLTKVRHMIKVQFNMANSNERLYDAVYGGKAERAD